MENTTIKRRSSIKIMGKMIGLVKPLAHIMTAAVLLGILGYLCAIFLTITAGKGLLLAMKGVKIKNYLIALVILAVMRGMLHYAEQYCNHFIAFKLLAIIRHKVFAALRKLCPAKLEGKEKGNVTFDQMILATIAMMGSFGPVTALSSLSNNLNQTLASGERVLSLLEETPMVEELEGEQSFDFEEASVCNVTFSYDKEVILKDCNINMEQGKVIGIYGKSGCGKSTLLKLLMRFWDVDQGKVMISDQNIKEIPTKTLRNTQSYVTQETELFHDSIANNIAIGKPGASREEII